MSHPPYPGPSEPMQPLSWGPPPPPMGRAAPGRGLALAAALIAIGWAVLEVVETFLAYSAQDDYLAAAKSGVPAWDVWTAYDFVAIPWTFIAIAAYVVVCLWLYQLRSHLDVVRPEARHARRKGWIWAGWLVPVVNLWFPFQIVRDVLKALLAPTGMVVGWWWAFWLLALSTEQIGPQLVGTDDVYVEGVRQLGNVEAANAVFTIAALVFWLLIISRIVDAQGRAEAA